MLKKLLHSIPKQYLLLCKVYTLWILIFTFFRFTLLLLNSDSLTDQGQELLFDAFVWGFTFDNIIISYVMILPFLLLSFSLIKTTFAPILTKICKVYLFIMQLICIPVLVFDLPYFSYYSARLNPAVLSWLKTPGESMKAVVGDFRYYPFLFLGGILFYATYFIYLKSKTLDIKPFLRAKLIPSVLGFLILGTLIFRGMRGSFDFDRSPIDFRDSFYSKETFNNLLTMNPIYNFIDGLIKVDIIEMEDDKAISIVTKTLNTDNNHPFLRRIKGDSIQQKNVVLIIMESMSANKTGFIAGGTSLTPFLDSIANKSLAYKNIYTSGIHTHNGIFSSLYAYPSNMDRLPMFESLSHNLNYYGLPNVLKEKGYHNMYFCTTKAAFDNTDNFLLHNGFGDQVFDMDYFSEEKQVNNWGVPDHVLFNESIPKLQKAAKEGKPFFATYMTISTHTPHVMNENNTPIPFKSEDGLNKSYEYADWSMKQFLEKVKNETWYNNTLFVFVADHGQRFDVTYEMPLAYHHTPMIFYTPDGSINSEIKNDIGLQIDLFPTAMGILGFDYKNTCPGIDLKQTKRPYAFFTADDKLGVLDDKHFLIVRKDGSSALYDYKNKSTTDVTQQFVDKAKKMKDYAIANLHTAEIMKSKHIIDPNQFEGKR